MRDGRRRESEEEESELRSAAANLQATNTQVRPKGQVCRREDIEVEADVAGADLEEALEHVVQQELPGDERAEEDAARQQSVEQRERVRLQRVLATL